MHLARGTQISIFWLHSCDTVPTVQQIASAFSIPDSTAGPARDYEAFWNVAEKHQLPIPGRLEPPDSAPFTISAPLPKHRTEIGPRWFENHLGCAPGLSHQTAKVRNVSKVGSHFLGSQECYFPTSGRSI
jgi:hypothetical protein